MWSLCSFFSKTCCKKSPAYPLYADRHDELTGILRAATFRGCVGVIPECPSLDTDAADADDPWSWLLSLPLCLRAITLPCWRVHSYRHWSSSGLSGKHKKTRSSPRKCGIFDFAVEPCPSVWAPLTQLTLFNQLQLSAPYRDSFPAVAAATSCAFRHAPPGMRLRACASGRAPLGKASASKRWPRASSQVGGMSGHIKKHICRAGLCACGCRFGLAWLVVPGPVFVAVVVVGCVLLLIAARRAPAQQLEFRYVRRAALWCGTLVPCSEATSRQASSCVRRDGSVGWRSPGDNTGVRARLLPPPTIACGARRQVAFIMLLSCVDSAFQTGTTSRRHFLCAVVAAVTFVSVVAATSAWCHGTGHQDIAFRCFRNYRRCGVAHHVLSRQPCHLNFHLYFRPPSETRVYNHVCLLRQ